MEHESTKNTKKARKDKICLSCPYPRCYQKRLTKTTFCLQCDISELSINTDTIL